MGILKLFSRRKESQLMPLPSGSFTLNRDGRIMTSTLPQAFPEAQALEIGQVVLSSFRSAESARMPLAEIIVNFASLKLLARELRGGAIVFLVPQAGSGASLRV